MSTYVLIVVINHTHTIFLSFRLQLKVTGNSCKDVGYDTYNWPNGFYPGNIPVCDQPLPHDGRGVPEQFWNCGKNVECI